VNKIFLPLSEDCYSTTYCINNNLRSDSFPLDWVYASPVRAFNCLKSEFKDLYKADDLDVAGTNPQVKGIESKYCLFNKNYCLLMPHFIVDLDQDIVNMQSKMQHRANKLINYFKSKTPLEVVYKPLSSINKRNTFFKRCYSESQKQEFGLHNMNIVFPEIKDYLVNAYDYNPNDISLRMARGGSTFKKIGRISRGNSYE
jgi:hypothetical protein